MTMHEVVTDNQTPVTDLDAQYAYNRQVCDGCGNPRFIHVQAILCTETEPSVLELMNEIQEVRAMVTEVHQFIGFLETAIKSHPMASMLFK